VGENPTNKRGAPYITPPALLKENKMFPTKGKKMVPSPQIWDSPIPRNPPF